MLAEVSCISCVALCICCTTMSLSLIGAVYSVPVHPFYQLQWPCEELWSCLLPDDASSEKNHSTRIAYTA